MKHWVLFFAVLLGAQHNIYAQDATPSTKIYNPEANAENQIRDAIAQAQKQQKHILLQIGGNWCVWCRRFHQLVTTNDTLSKILTENYVVIHINYSPENKNEKLLSTLSYPQRFGFPAFVILNAEGNRIHTQNSAYLEEGKGYSVKKVAEFLKQWTPAALDPERYKTD